MRERIRLEASQLEGLSIRRYGRRNVAEDLAAAQLRNGYASHS
jgi:hypothetical protein